jgi:tripartite-type tricarboxylate transporter receptor subunit TctC
MVDFGDLAKDDQAKYSRRAWLDHTLQATLVLSAGGLGTGAMVFGSTAALAQSGPAPAYPTKPINLIVPWPPGGSTDRHLRKFAEVASKYLGQAIVVENKPGAGGMLGPSTMAAAAKADGYTLAQLPMSAFRIPHMQPVSWDPIRDFTYIIGLTGYTFGITVRSDSRFKTIQEMVEFAKTNPEKLSVGNTGTGTTPHLVMEELGMRTGAKFLHVPFKGNSENTLALLGGHTDALSDATGWGPNVDAGKMRLLMTFGERRTKRWSYAPTAKELGYGIVSNSPYGIVAPKGLDPRIQKHLHDAFRKALDDSEHIKMLDTLDQEYWYKNSEDYLTWAKQTLESEKKLIEALGLMKK